MYQVDCRSINSYTDFIEAFNKELIEPAGGKWNGNLDAFNDYLSWPEQNPYRLVLLGADRCAEVLGYKANPNHEKELWPMLKEILQENKEWAIVEIR